MKNCCVYLFIVLMSFQAVAVARADEEVIHINPQTLREYLIENNASILLGLNAVHQSKNIVSIARAQLLPSINLGTLISSGPTFALAAVEMLLPFLLPAKWFSLGQTKNLFEVEKISYYLLELNQYASVSSLVQTIRGDMQIREILHAEYRDLSSIKGLLETQYSLGMVSAETLAHAKAQVEMAELNVSLFDQLLSVEVAEIRNLIGATAVQKIVFDDGAIAASEIENDPLETITAAALSLAPENLQFDYLIKAAKSEKWKQLWGFIGNSSLSSRSASGEGASFGSMAPTVSINLGVEMIPAYQLSNNNIKQLELRKTFLVRDVIQTVESTVKSLNEVKKQFQLATQAESNMELVYNVKKTKYDLGMISLMTLLQTRSQMTSAAIAKIKAQVDLDNLRITLHRVGEENFHVLPTGVTTTTPGALLTVTRMTRFLAEAKARFALILIDAPPVISYAETAILGGVADGVALVVESERTKREIVTRAKDTIEEAKGNILGVVLNRRRYVIPEFLYRYL